MKVSFPNHYSLTRRVTFGTVFLSSNLVSSWNFYLPPRQPSRGESLPRLKGLIVHASKQASEQATASRVISRDSRPLRPDFGNNRPDGKREMNHITVMGQTGSPWAREEVRITVRKQSLRRVM